MARRAPSPRSSARRSRPAQAYAASAFIEPLARILMAGGHSPAALQRALAAACRRRPKNSTQGYVDRDLVDLPHVLSIWHGDRKFIDANGQPKALPLSGPNSLSALVRRVFPNRSPQGVIAALERSGALQRIDGRYLPTGRTLRFDPADGIPHGLEALLGLLRTIDYNLGRRGAQERIFERIARNAHVPESQVPRFEKAAREQLLSILVRLDTRLARYESRRRPGERTVSVGVGTYMIAGPAGRTRR